MGRAFCCKIVLIVIYVVSTGKNVQGRKEKIEKSLQIIHDVAIRSLGSLCVTEQYRALLVPISTSRFESARQKADLAATLLQDLGVAHHNGSILSLVSLRDCTQCEKICAVKLVTDSRRNFLINSYNLTSDTMEEIISETSCQLSMLLV
ncbi:hypothetical protein HHI36_014195 [Cryptolaemus montrouzieri]|uniref:Uncharacterized protein n=1 Tax=Cryptolaemus montrouzieri TaxID=559131 RepID=A0ABD2N1S8_9CUCU